MYIDVNTEYRVDSFKTTQVTTTAPTLISCIYTTSIDISQIQPVIDFLNNNDATSDTSVLQANATNLSVIINSMEIHNPTTHCVYVYPSGYASGVMVPPENSAILKFKEPIAVLDYSDASDGDLVINMVHEFKNCTSTTEIFSSNIQRFRSGRMNVTITNEE